jgi:hypothetical protein
VSSPRQGDGRHVAGVKLQFLPAVLAEFEGERPREDVVQLLLGLVVVAGRPIAGVERPDRRAHPLRPEFVADGLQSGLEVVEVARLQLVEGHLLRCLGHASGFGGWGEEFGWPFVTPSVSTPRSTPAARFPSRPA